MHHSTRIPNIETGIPMPLAAGFALRVAGPVIGRLLTWQARRASRPTPASQSLPVNGSFRSRIWAEATNVSGARAGAMLETGEGYQAAAAVAVRALELQLVDRRIGAMTPVQAFGAGLALSMPTTVVTDLPL